MDARNGTQAIDQQAIKGGSTVAALDGAPALSQHTRDAHVPRLKATLLLAIAVYLLTVAGCALMDLETGILAGVPVSLGLAVLLGHLATGSRAPRTLAAAQIAALIVALGLSLACLSYVCAALSLPLRDGEMIAIDRWLGFHWLRMMLILDQRPGLLTVLDAAYATFTFQLVMTVVLLLLAKRERDLEHFLITFVCASLIAEIASVLVPTLGPMHVMAERVGFENVPTLGRNTAEIVLALRDGTLDVIDVRAIDGIISFPSLHAAVAILVPFALRWSRWLFVPVVVLDGLMLVSTVPCGNHFLVDVIGGVAVALLAILCAKPLQRALDRSPLLERARHYPKRSRRSAAAEGVREFGL